MPGNATATAPAEVLVSEHFGGAPIVEPRGRLLIGGVRPRVLFRERERANRLAIDS